MYTDTLNEIFTEVHNKHFSEFISRKMTIAHGVMKVGDEPVMFAAEQEAMQRYAHHLFEHGSGHVLEIGFGLGVFAEAAHQYFPTTYTAIEVHPEIAEYASQRLSDFQSHSPNVITKPWQLALPGLGKFDIVMCDSCPPPGYSDFDFENLVSLLALKHLNKGGRFSFFWCGETMSEKRDKIIHSHFSRVTYDKVSMSKPPKGWVKDSCSFIIATCFY